MNDLAQRIDDNIARVADFPQPGIQYKDITSLFQQPELCNEMVEAFAEFSRGKIDAVCGIESRGFLFGLLIAQKLNLPFVLVRKQGKLPPPTVAESYELEYGNATIEVQPQYIQNGQRFLVHDDVLATGGTAEATAKLIEKCGGKVVQFSFIAELEFLHGREKLNPFTTDIQSLVRY
ncbi:adenine phosphoribosyltransferase [Moheibacter lacus]|uniref:Adenine phosphoribosyltransferase n=1 Tax=Moheibacter lacus TaxID=2745851 RepID=A0A838ZSW9_9FLAO|nr:adenine phosphoribosyltransferase [Moheibacter lacus]MBA5630076.1 adenine phosphoribosyltransferase [Moheibacter lacus]